MLLLQKNLQSRRSISSLWTGSGYSFHRLFSGSSISSTKAASKNSSPQPHFIIEYLIKSCGLSLEKATKASKRLSHLKSPSKLDTVLQFLRCGGLSDAVIGKAVSVYPDILCARVEETLKPRMRELENMGFSPSHIEQLLWLSPVALTHSSLQDNVKFWMPILGSVEEILKAVKRNRYLLTCSIEKVIVPNLSFLEEHCAMSAYQVVTLPNSWLVTSNPDLVKDSVRRAEGFGIPCGSRLFKQALASCSQTQSTINAKIDMLMCQGFSEAEVSSIIRKQPALLALSKEKICCKIDFLTKEVGLQLSYIARQPVLLSLSLERRLVPRNYVLKSLKSNGLTEVGRSFCNFMIISENNFIEKFVRPYRDIIPRLGGVYSAACAGRAPTEANSKNM